MKITVFDTETTGVIPKDFNSLDECPYMLQLGSITYDTCTNMITTTINEIIKIPDHVKIPENVSEINSITHERVNNEGVNVVDLLKSFNEQIQNSNMVVAHNIDFDINIVNYECMRNNVEFEGLKLNKENSYCTMSKGTALCKIQKENTKGKYYKWPTLEELHYYLFGKKLKDLHDAYNDLIICLRCYMYMNYMIDITEKNDTLKEQIGKLLQ
tara:strand:- start:42 stop:680 length:639 start_codon:yes stop_codon:yes gene_type:complete